MATRLVAWRWRLRVFGGVRTSLLASTCCWSLVIVALASRSSAAIRDPAPPPPLFSHVESPDAEAAKLSSPSSQSVGIWLIRGAARPRTFRAEGLAIPRFRPPPRAGRNFSDTAPSVATSRARDAYRRAWTV